MNLPANYEHGFSKGFVMEKEKQIITGLLLVKINCVSYFI